jgi:hypothetical protein
MISYLYFPAIKSAALRKTAARSAKGSCSHSALAPRAESIALLTSDVEAPEYLATTVVFSAGLNCSLIVADLIYFESSNVSFWSRNPLDLLNEAQNRVFRLTTTTTTATSKDLRVYRQ